MNTNRAELAQVVGAWNSEAQLHERAQRLRTELGLSALLLTRSEEGMSLFDQAGHVQVPAQAREVFDVTGAGDTGAAIIPGNPGCPPVTLARSGAGSRAFQQAGSSGPDEEPDRERSCSSNSGVRHARSRGRCTCSVSGERTC